MKEIIMSKHLNSQMKWIIGKMQLTDDYYNLLSEFIEAQIKENNELPKIEIGYSYLKDRGILQVCFEFIHSLDINN